MRTFTTVMMVMVSTAAWAGSPASFPIAEWDALLKKYVDDAGRVRYSDVDPAQIEKLYGTLAAAPSGSRTAREAFYLNAYNVIVWKNVLARLPKLKSVIDEKESFFDRTTFEVAGASRSLSDLENKVIRPELKDPRAHMALNCASGGCPMLPREAFVAERVDAQLDREVKKFVAEKRNVDFDAATKTVRLSHIFDWYRDDFGKESDKVLAWIDRYREKGVQIPTDAKIVYVDYDWRLNDAKLTR